MTKLCFENDRMILFNLTLWHTACEAVEGTFDEDSIDVLLLELLVQSIDVGHDFVKKPQEKNEIFIM